MDSLGIFTTDRDLRVTTWDTWLEKATGISGSDIKGKPLYEVIHDLDKRNLGKRFKNVIENGVVEVLSPVFHHYLIPCRPLSPSRFYENMQQRVTIAPLKENEIIVGTIVTVEDMTEKLERERLYSEKLKSTSEVERLSAVQMIVQEEKIEQKDIIKDVLKDESWRVRKVAVEGLKKRTDSEIVGSLLKALKEEHHNINVLNSAIQILTMSELNVVDTLIDFLSSDDHELRQYAALSLGEIGDKKAIRHLIVALNDADPNVRYHAIEALGKMKAKEAIETILNIVETRDFFLAFPAIDALVNIGDEGVAPRIAALLHDEMLAGPAIDALGALGREGVVPLLASAINEGDSHIESILKAIIAIYDRYNEQYGEGTVIADIVKKTIDKKGAEKIIALMDDASDETLHLIATFLGWLEGEDIDIALTRILGKTSARKEIIDSVVRHGQQIVNLLIDQVNSDDIEIRKSAIIALGLIGNNRAVPAIISALEDEPDVAVIAAGALAKIGDRSAFEALIGKLGEQDVGVRQAVISALNSIGHPQMPHRMVNLLTDEDPIVRESAVKIAGYFGYSECIDLIFERCGDEAENVRYAAIQCLPYLDDRRVLPIIADTLKKDTPKVRGAAAYALGMIDDREAFKYLKDALKDNDPWVRYFAVKAAGESAYPEALELLLDMVDNDRAEQVRIAAIESIGKIGGEKAVSILSKFLWNENFDVARVAVAALGRINHPDAVNHLLLAVRSNNMAIKLEAIHALGERGGKEAVETLKWLAGSEENDRIAEEAIESLSRIGSRDAIRALMELTSNKSRKTSCISRLSQFIGRYIEWISDGLYDPNPAVRSSVVDVLARMKHPDATEALIKALDDQDTQVRLAAVNALGYLGSRYGDKKLARIAVYDKDETVRTAAERVLKQRSDY